MTDRATIRTLIGLDASVVSDAVIDTCIDLGTEWCTDRASGYGVTAPDSAVVMMTVYFLRQHLDLAGIKPSSISMPDLSMSTDLNGSLSELKDAAITAIKSAAAGKGAAFRQIRSGRVGRWHRARLRRSWRTPCASHALSTIMPVQTSTASPFTVREK